MQEITQDVYAAFGTGSSNGSNHLHLLVNSRPTVALSRWMNNLKSVSYLRLRREFFDVTHHYWRAEQLWSGSHFAGSVGGASTSVLRQYIEQQDRLGLTADVRPPLPPA
jgi:putative transposase